MDPTPLSPWPRPRLSRGARFAQRYVGEVSDATIGRHLRVTRRLGVGGMASVYLCWDLQHGRWCAVKVISDEMAEVPAHRARFVQEARAMASLRHTHILELFSLADDVESPFLVMEHAAGGNVYDRLQAQGPLRPGEAVYLMADVCAALQSAHDLGIVHRDIKPPNLLLTADGRVRVGDFGVARFEQELRLTRNNMTVGTLAYMAPEQAHDPRRVDPRSDVYSAGACLFALLTARRPVELLGLKRQAALSQLPDGLRQVVAQATALEARRRTASAADLETQLRRLAAQLPDAAPLQLSPARLPEPPPEPEVELSPGELLGTQRPWSGDVLIPGVLRAAITPTAGGLPRVASPPARRRLRWLALTGLLLAGCAGGCAGLATAAGFWLAGAGLLP